MSKKIIICSGGTGGHILPAIRFGNFLIKQGFECTLILDERGKLLESSPLIATKDVEKSFKAVCVDSIKGNIDCPHQFQNLLTFLLFIGLSLILFFIWRSQEQSKR